MKIEELPQEKIELDQEKKLVRNRIHSLHKYYGNLIPAITHWAIKKYTQPSEKKFMELFKKKDEMMIISKDVNYLRW
jgi:hypothetical protein